MLAQIEQGNRQIHADEIVTFARALGVPAAALLGDDSSAAYQEGFEAGYAAAIQRISDLALRGRSEA